MVKNEEIRKTALLCLLLEHFGDINGRTRLQKLVYLANLSGWNAFNDYFFHQFGPYSQSVMKEIESLKVNNIVSETQIDFTGDRVIYNYQLTELGKGIVRKIMNVLDDKDLIENTKTLLDKFASFSSDDLEVMATLVFLRRADSNKKDNELVTLVELYKPRFGWNQIRRNLKVFDLLQEFVPSS
jgi:uncharacterized protein